MKDQSKNFNATYSLKQLKNYFSTEFIVSGWIKKNQNRITNQTNFIKKNEKQKKDN